MWQIVVVGIVLTGAVGYAARRVYISFKKANDPCYGCTGCALKDIKDKKIAKKGITAIKSSRKIWQYQ